DPGFRGGVRVAVGDVNGDGVPDIVTGAGPGGGPHVKVFSGADDSVLASFYAYDPTFAGGVYVAVGDVNGDGFADVITGAGPGGGPHVKVFAGLDNAELASFFAADPGNTGGVFVAAGAFGNVGPVVATSSGSGPQVSVFNFQGGILTSFFAYRPQA